MNFENSLSFAKKLDKKDPLKSFRQKFHLPKGNGKPALYFTGNSLGLQPKSTKSFLNQELADWATLGVEGHFHAKRPWLYYHKFSKKALSKLVGAKAIEVVAMNQLTVNLHLMMTSFYQPTATRYKIMTEAGAFPSDQYAFESQLKIHHINPEDGLIELTPRPGEYSLRTEDILKAIDEHRDQLALVIFGAVQYYSGQFFDIKKITEASHHARAYVGFDLAHAIGNVPLSLHNHQVDFAVWCSYKYLNAGPGGIAGAFVHEKHAHNESLLRLAGWWGHHEKERFQMKKGFIPMAGVDGWQLSNVPILSSAALLASLSLFEEAGIKNLRNKSVLLTGFLEYLLTSIDQYSEYFTIITNGNPSERGSQLSILMKQKGKKVFTTLTKKGVIADWREPNAIRLAPVPLYNTFEEVFQLVEIFKSALRKIMMNSSKHIAICGAGLVGSLLSIYLVKRGYQVSVFERRGDMRKSGNVGGRSINLALSNRGIRALDEVGLAEEMKLVAIPMHGRMMHDRAGVLSFLPYGKQGQFINSVSRSALNMVLMNKAEKLGVDFHFEQRITKVDLEKTVLTVDSQESTFNRKFDLIIGADGAFSAVRGALLITDRFDYSQDYIDHGYKELHIPPGAAGSFQLEKNALHIWPRESFMMIALPNPDGSFTCTLFFPFEGSPSFNQLKTDAEVSMFFESTFPDAVALMPALLEDYNANPTSSLVTVRCFPWVKNNTLLIGDAAHAIVPFFGQGMNAGFEDCRLLNDLLNQHDDNWKEVFTSFQYTRKKDADAIAQLALDNFIEMRDLVADADFLLRKKIEAKLHQLYPNQWIPLYSMVTFHDSMPYSMAYETGLKQKKIMDVVMKRKDIERDWESLDFKSIVESLNNA